MGFVRKKRNSGKRNNLRRNKRRKRGRRPRYKLNLSLRRQKKRRRKMMIRSRVVVSQKRTKQTRWRGRPWPERRFSPFSLIHISTHLHRISFLLTCFTERWLHWRYLYCVCLRLAQGGLLGLLRLLCEAYVGRLRRTSHVIRHQVGSQKVCHSYIHFSLHSFDTFCGFTIKESRSRSWGTH